MQDCKGSLIEGNVKRLVKRDLIALFLTSSRLLCSIYLKILIQQRGKDSMMMWDIEISSRLTVVNLLRLLVFVLVLRLIACVGMPKYQGRARYLRTLCLNRDYDVDRVR